MATENEDKPTEEKKPELTNADVKSHPLFVKLAEQVGELTKREEARLAADAEAAKAAELKKAQEAGKFEELIKQRDAEIALIKAENERQLLNKDLMLELTRAGFVNSTFIKGAFADYTKEHGTPAEYAAKLAQDEANKMFLASAANGPPAPPPSVRVSGSPSSLSIEQAKKLEKSSDPQDRAKWREYMNNHMRQNGKLPY